MNLRFTLCQVRIFPDYGHFQNFTDSSRHFLSTFSQAPTNKGSAGCSPLCFEQKITAPRLPRRRRPVFPMPPLIVWCGRVAVFIRPSVERAPVFPLPSPLEIYNLPCNQHPDGTRDRTDPAAQPRAESNGPGAARRRNSSTESPGTRINRAFVVNFLLNSLSFRAAAASVLLGKSTTQIGFSNYKAFCNFSESLVFLWIFSVSILPVVLPRL